jgi:hypothetical protein
MNRPQARVREVEVPGNTEIGRHLEGAFFADAWELAPVDAAQSAMDFHLHALAATPRWVDALMGLRNRVVAQFGLKSLGALGAVNRAKPADAYRVGDRVGIFSLRSLAQREVVLEDRDKHLDVKVSVAMRGTGAETRAVVSTVVHLNNRFGRVYMLFVKPVHRLIVPALLRRAARRG